MQSFASPTHTNPPPHKNHAPHFIPRPTKRAQLSPIPTPFLPKNPQKGRKYRLYLRPFCQKTIERAQLSLVLAKNITIFAKKQINHNYYDKQRINRKSL